MNFQAALTAMQAGHRVRRGKRFISLREGRFYETVTLGVFEIALRTVDILATDWELVEP